MSLAQQMIDDVNTRTTAQLAAIEESQGQIEEAETLAATLRSFGLRDACAGGFPRYGRNSGVITYVQVPQTSAEAIMKALADADLQLDHFMATPSNIYTDIHLAGLDTYLVIDASTGQELFDQRARINAREPAHA